MYRRTVIAIAAAAVAAGIAIPALAASGARHKTQHFTETLVGTGISKKQSVYKVHSSTQGNGAAVQTFTSTNSQGGTSTAVTYYRNGSSKGTADFKFGKPQNGFLPITGSGHTTGGTGADKGVHATYTFKGTENIKTGIVKVTVTGTSSK
jgi:hypothetical protein